LTRTSYHHGDLRQSLIECACDKLREDSADHLSLRALARQAGVSQTAPYRHFETKNALFAAVATYGLSLMTDHLQEARDAYLAHAREGVNEGASENAEEIIEGAVVAVGLAYVEWALANPEKYQLFFDSTLVDYGAHEDLHEAGCDCFEVLLELIRDGIRQGIFLNQAAEELAATLWASVHGLASLLHSKDAEAMRQHQDAPVVKGMAALSMQRRQVIELFVKSIRR
jgi:AcrR family transcriptional regulator